MATKKMTGKDISTEQVLAAVGDGATFGDMCAKLGLPCDSRALDQALQREKRAGRIRLGEKRRWVKADAPPAAKAKRERSA
jgi:hypothetical protein